VRLAVHGLRSTDPEQSLAGCCVTPCAPAGLPQAGTALRCHGCRSVVRGLVRSTLLRHGTACQTYTPMNRRVDLRSRVKSWLATPLSKWWCAFGWCAATALCVGIVALLGGPSSIDKQESVYGTWAIAHGQMACSYPAVSLPGYPPVAPLYLLLSGGISATVNIGHAVPFPSAATLGPGCNKIFTAMDSWSVHSGASGPTLWIGCIGWLTLMVGVVAWLRASGRGRCGWEPATLVFVACLPPVWMCIETVFHPQDLMALGLALCAMACAHRGRWISAGILVALAVFTQQFALLVAAPLLVLAPAKRRIPYAMAALITGAVVAVPLLIVTAGRALRAITIGTGNSPSSGGTVLWQLHLYGAQAVLLSRVTPILVSVALSWWVLRRLGPGALQPVILTSIVAVSLGLRLAFEQNMFSYYFMALAVSLVLLDAVRGSVRNSTVAWLAAVALVFCLSRGLAWQVPLGLVTLIPLLIVAPALLVTLFRVLRGSNTRNLLPWLGVAACAFLTWPDHVDPLNLLLLTWFWQVALVIPGIMLAAGVLLADIGLAKPESHLRRIETISMVE
jgi:hypothetical protein